MKKMVIKGFTLIELLVVIAILGIIMAAVVAGINPIDKINAANDAKVQADIGALGTSMEAFVTLNSGTYAGLQSDLVTSGDLKVVLTPPTGYTYNWGCSTAFTSGGCTTQSVYATLKSNKYTSTPYWKWCSSTGKAGAVAATSSCP